MKEKIVQFDSNRKISNTSSSQIGTIYIDLYVDQKGLLFTPSYELEDGLDDELIDAFARMLKKHFPQAIDQLFEGYKSGM